MAPLDLARARRLAESISDEGLRGYALGMMALRLAETGKDSARRCSRVRTNRSSVRPGPARPRSSSLFYAHGRRGRLAAGRGADRPRARR